jgi:RND family efflux transporter MFP subunit
MRTTSILFIFALLIAACSKQEPTSETSQTVSDKKGQGTLVQVMQVQPSTKPLPVHATGTVASSSEIKLSFKIPGIVSAIYVEEGQKVRKGQVLARINPTEINAQVRQAEIALEKAERDLERATALYKDTVITLEQLQNTQSARDAASTQVEIAGYNRDNAVIISNVNGRVLKRFAEKGEMVGAGVPVL